MIKDEWHCVAGIHSLKDGRLSAVWLGHHKARDTVFVFDCVTIRRNVPVVIAERLNAGNRRWIPIAWHKAASDLADKLLLCGCNMEPQPVADSDEAADAVSRAIEERLISERFKVLRDVEEWQREYDSGFRFQENKIPVDSHPLMAATRHAMSILDYARRQAPRGLKSANYPKLAVI